MWTDEDYLTEPIKQSLVIVKVKIRIEEIISAGFDKNNGEISILSVFKELEKLLFGFVSDANADYF